MLEYQSQQQQQQVNVERMQTVKQTLSDIRAHESHNYTLLTKKSGGNASEREKRIAKKTKKNTSSERTNETKRNGRTDGLCPR